MLLRFYGMKQGSEIVSKRNNGLGTHVRRPLGDLLGLD
jgi:hypothetical protein